MNEFLDRLDHPIVFVFFLMLALAGMSSIFLFITKGVGLNGAAYAIRH